MSQINDLKDTSRMESALKFPIAWAAEKVVDAMPAWHAYGILPEFYTSMKGGLWEAANMTKHKHGLNMLDLPKHCGGFQNLYSVLNFPSGILNTEEVYTFRRNDNGLETPIDYRSPSRQPSAMQLQQEGEQSIDNELEFGNSLVKSLLDPKARRGDFIRAQCVAELTDGDTSRAPDPTGYLPQFSEHELFLCGQIGNRTLVASTPHGAVYRYRAPSKLQKFETYLRMDMRYTIRNAPIEWLGLEKLKVFKGLPLQRVLQSLAAGTIGSEQEDYISSMTPQGLPVRMDGYINPIARYLPRYK
ncbi:MAG: hypothetical protein JXC85_02800 [Candidatus Aenigmarchaeota archaeon]|nr:hypothetical protein [Candidatus Aenigmarchaeota archaeon]